MISVPFLGVSVIVYNCVCALVSLATPSLTREAELCNLDGFDDVTSSGATRCDQVIAIS